MMGAERKRRPKLFYYQFNLEKRIRPDHPLRKVLKWVDFNFVRPLVKKHYGSNGHVSEDPIVIVKLMFLLFFENLKSERELMRMLPERLDYLWFLGFDLEDEIPHHSILSKARRRWGEELFRELFIRVVWQCVEAGLVGGDKIHLDGSLVDANTSLKSVMRGGPELIEALKQAYASEERKLEGVESEDVTNRSYYRKKNAELVSRTDPQAAVVKQSGRDVSRPRYKHHRAVDDAGGVITALESTAGDVEENARMMALVRQHEANTGRKVGTVVADTQYGTTENFARCALKGIQAHMADGKARRRHPVWGEEVFRYDEEADCYWCPAGQVLKPQKHRKKRTFRVYKAAAETCQGCALKRHCTRSRFGRTVRRHICHEQIQRARAQSHSGPARRDRRRRKYLIEGSFADATNNHHFKRARWRGLVQQQIQDYLIAVCQNVRMLLRHAPEGPAVAVGRPLFRHICAWSGSAVAWTRSFVHWRYPLVV